MDAPVSLHQALIQLIPVAGGSIIGSGITLSITIFNANRQRNAERLDEKRNLASAFYGELTALMHISEARKYIATLNSVLNKLKADPNIERPSAFSISRDYFSVYTSNVGKLGMLPVPLPEKIATFYAYANAIAEDANRMDDNRIKAVSNEEFRYYIEQLIYLFSLVHKLADEICEKIRSDKSLFIAEHHLASIDQTGAAEIEDANKKLPGD